MGISGWMRSIYVPTIRSWVLAPRANTVSLTKDSGLPLTCRNPEFTTDWVMHVGT